MVADREDLQLLAQRPIHVVDQAGQHFRHGHGTARELRRGVSAKVVAEHGEKVAVGLDVKIVDGDHRLRGRGWETDGGDLWEVLERLDREGCSRSSLDDLRAIGTLVDGGVEGAIVGKALYAGRFTLPQALAAVAQ